MRQVEILKSSIHDAFVFVQTAETSTAVSTQCMYPDGDSVFAHVSKTPNGYRVSDNAGAFSVLDDYSKTSKDWHKFLKKYAEKYELETVNCEIRTPDSVQADEVAMWIMIVANASKEAADTGMQKLKLAQERQFREILDEVILDNFSEYEIASGVEMVGAYNTKQKFDYAVYSKNRTTLIDPVMKDGNSINSKFVSHWNIREAKMENVQQIIFYDTAENWDSANLQMLGQVANVVDYHQAQESIRQLAA